MNYNKFALFVIVALEISCAAKKNMPVQEKNITLPFNKMMVVSVAEGTRILNELLTPEFETFDFKRLDEKQNNYEAWITDRAKNADSLRKISIEYYENSLHTLYEYDTRGKIIRQTTKYESFISDVKYLDSFFVAVKEYYGNGNIKKKGAGTGLGFNIGKEYNYDKTGKLTKITDFDDGYIFDYDKVFQFCDKNGIYLERQPNRGPFTQIGKGKYRDKPCWYILSPNFEKGHYDNFTLDAKTGKILKKFSTPLPFIE